MRACVYMIGEMELPPAVVTVRQARAVTKLKHVAIRSSDPRPTRLCTGAVCTPAGLATARKCSSSATTSRGSGSAGSGMARMAQRSSRCARGKGRRSASPTRRAASWILASESANSTGVLAAAAAGAASSTCGFTHKAVIGFMVSHKFLLC